MQQLYNVQTYWLNKRRIDDIPSLFERVVCENREMSHVLPGSYSLGAVARQMRTCELCTGILPGTQASVTERAGWSLVCMVLVYSYAKPFVTLLCQHCCC